MSIVHYMLYSPLSKINLFTLAIINEKHQKTRTFIFANSQFRITHLDNITEQ